MTWAVYGTGGTMFPLASMTSAGTYTTYTTGATTASVTPIWVQYQQTCPAYQGSPELTLGEYLLPDGATLRIAVDGSYAIEDENAKVLYRACRVREFNPYINASDLLEAFITEVGKYDGVNQGDVLALPIEAFINWIILEAAKRDGDPIDDLPTVESALLRRLSSPNTQQMVRAASESSPTSDQSLHELQAIL